MLTLLPMMLAAAAAVSASPASAATCDDYGTQAEAQRAADTRDPDGDGRYCEDLPCPCGQAAGPSSGEGGERPATTSRCTRRGGLVRLSFSATAYPNVRRHFRRAVADGWPRSLVLSRPSADARRARLFRDVPTRQGFDRDEYPPAVGRGRGRGLTRGKHPRGWRADVAYVPSSENRSHGSRLGAKLRRFCNGTQFRYVFR